MKKIPLLLLALHLVTTSLFSFELKKGDVILEKFNPPPTYWEIPEGSCGEACIWSISQFFKINISQKEINKQKEILAFEATKICHGEAAAIDSLERAKNMFSGFVDVGLLPEKTVRFNAQEIKDGKKLIEILRETELCESGGEAKRLIKGGGVKVDDEKIEDENLLIKFAANQPFLKVALGKKKLFKINIIRA